MTSIVELTNNGDIEDEDLLPFYSQKNAATRSVSFGVLSDLVPTIKSISYSAPTLTITMTDETEFEVDIS